MYTVYLIRKCLTMMVSQKQEQFLRFLLRIDSIHFQCRNRKLHQFGFFATKHFMPGSIVYDCLTYTIKGTLKTMNYSLIYELDTLTGARIVININFIRIIVPYIRSGFETG